MKTDTATKTTVEFTQTFSESEARALDALVGYGIDGFLKFFYEHMGKSYMQPHESGLRSLFATIGHIRAALGEVDHHRRLLATALKAARDEQNAALDALSKG